MACSSKHNATHTVIWDFFKYLLFTSLMLNIYMQIRCFWYILPTEKDITSEEKTKNCVRLNVE